MNPVRRTETSLADEILQQIHPASHPPKDFDRLKASNPDLVKYGLPPRPPQGSDQQIQDRWHYNMSQPLHYIYPNFHIKRNGLHHRKPATVPDNSTTSISPDWCGAILSPPQGQRFLAVCANWTVPNAYPPDSARIGESTWNDGVYYRCITVGLDGEGENTCDLLIGTTSEVEVSGGRIIRQSAYAQARYPTVGPDVELTNFTTNPGDLICGRVNIDPSDNTKGTVILLNESSAQYTSFRFDLRGGYHFGGGPAKWGLEDIGDLVDYQYDAFAKFGAIYIDEPFAVTPIDDVLRVSDLSNAAIVNMIHENKSPCSASKITSNLLKIY